VEFLLVYNTHFLASTGTRQATMEGGRGVLGSQFRKRFSESRTSEKGFLVEEIFYTHSLDYYEYEYDETV